MAEQYNDQLLNSKYNELTFEDRFSLLVYVEWARKNNKLDRLIRNANLRYTHACIEDIEYHADRRLDKVQILRLASGNYIQEEHNLIIKGASGNGKSYLACAFGVAACRQFYHVKYVRLPDLLDELAVARGDGTYQKVMKSYKKANLLIID
ncbi:DNA replication protein DnaC [Peribacillus cavernae]|nr:DNA replication protein DnaC [Peribacillus cavernae]